MASDNPPEDFYEGAVYRESYDMAFALLEARRFSAQHGRYRTHPAAGDPERIRAEVTRKVLIVRGDGRVAELVAMGIDDALEGRRPAW